MPVWVKISWTSYTDLQCKIEQRLFFVSTSRRMWCTHRTLPLEYVIYDSWSYWLEECISWTTRSRIVGWDMSKYFDICNDKLCRSTNSTLVNATVMCMKEIRQPYIWNYSVWNSLAPQTSRVWELVKWSQKTNTYSGPTICTYSPRTFQGFTHRFGKYHSFMLSIAIDGTLYSINCQASKTTDHHLVTQAKSVVRKLFISLISKTMAIVFAKWTLKCSFGKKLVIVACYITSSSSSTSW